MEHYLGLALVSIRLGMELDRRHFLVDLRTLEFWSLDRNLVEQHVGLDLDTLHMGMELS